MTGRADLSCRLSKLYHESSAAVFLPAVLAVFLANRKLRAVADRREPAGITAQRDQIVFYALRTLGTERQIVFTSSPLIAVSLDLDLRRRIGFQPLPVCL